MGGPGNGAHMHVDNVVYPSWQAQLSGTKLWTLMPPPECIYHCRKHHVTVHPGQISEFFLISRIHCRSKLSFSLKNIRGVREDMGWDSVVK